MNAKQSKFAKSIWSDVWHMGIFALIMIPFCIIMMGLMFCAAIVIGLACMTLTAFCWKANNFVDLYTCGLVVGMIGWLIGMYVHGLVERWKKIS